ncbi:MAG: aminotransferase class I/II-fold pyridoxal phosphate-dependent enzyme, partial [Deltaproteobacteria bacterium]|nr:aminotransferase class I/II-fold pyridoxal phosphate-dependent enzyme [Deltaproteobacteria bacterium]
MIPIFSNTLGKEELEMVAKVFESRWLGQGTHCTAFEEEFAAYLNTERVLLTNCCTASLYIALRALGISDGDEVILSTMNFVACASAVIDAGAIPVYADVNERTLNILPSEIARLRTERTKAVILLHYGGYPAPMDEIRNAAEGLLIIEDSANSIASRYKGQACGTLGDAGTWSFDAMKMLVMGDGGALWLKDEEAHEMAKAYRYLGLAPKTTSGMDSAGEKNSRWWEYDMAT